MDNLDAQALHEQYNPPVVGVGEPVLFRNRTRACWTLGLVHPPQRANWKPGDPLGKRICISVPSMGRVGDNVMTDVVHAGDPLHKYLPEIYHTVWELCNPGRVLSVGTTIAEMQDSLRDLGDRLTAVKGDLDAAHDINRSLQEQIDKLKAQPRGKAKADLAVA